MRPQVPRHEKAAWESRLKPSIILLGLIAGVGGFFFVKGVLRGDLRSYNAEFESYVSGYRKQDLTAMSKVMCQEARTRLPKTPEEERQLWEEERRRLGGIPREIYGLRGEPRRARIEVTIGERREVLMTLDIVEEEGELRVCPSDNHLLGEFVQE